MAYVVTLGPLHVMPGMPASAVETCTCRQARQRCAPPFVFSIPGQVGFRTALQHLTQCEREGCRALWRRVVRAMGQKLAWLAHEDCFLGCDAVQSQLYESGKPQLELEHFSPVARHLSRCPRESCAQLRRSLLLTIRESLRPTR